MTDRTKQLSNENSDRYISPIADIYETEEEYILTMDMPGVDKSGIEITVDNNELSITGKLEDSWETDELKHGEYTLHNYKRVFNIGEDIDGSAINAAINNGVLDVKLPKKEEIKPRKIEINVS